MSEENKRETKTVHVQGNEIVINTFVTGRDMRNIESALYDDISITQKGGEQELTGLSGKMLQARQDAQIKAVIVSINGKTEGLVDLILDFQTSVTEEIMKLVLDITEPKKETAGNEDQ